MATNVGEDSVAFSKWREVDINDDDYARGDTDAPVDKTQSENSEDEDPAAFFRMFGEDDEEDVYEDVRYDYQTPSSSSSPSSSSKTTTVVIRHHGAYPNSTGLAVWRGSEILARFLCHQQQLCDNNNSNNNSNGQDDETETPTGVVEVRQKKVLEVGAGAGLPGIVAHRVLGAKTVLVTDGDYDALNNLRHNVDANKLPCGNDKDAAEDDATTTTTTAATNTTISCQQLIWGRAVGAFLETHGKQDVVLAADCVYMVPSLQPLWKTIDALLKDDGIFVYAQTAASTVPWKDFSEMVERHGFESFVQVVGKELDRYDVDNDQDDADAADGNRREDEEYELGIYVFRRRR